MSHSMFTMLKPFRFLDLPPLPDLENFLVIVCIKKLAEVKYTLSG